jgi:hypothetical protein
LRKRKKLICCVRPGVLLVNARRDRLASALSALTCRVGPPGEGDFGGLAAEAARRSRHEQKLA